MNQISTRAEQWSPARYNADAAFVPAAAADLVDLLDPRTGERVLDLGCGDGELTQRITAAGAIVVGVDSAPAMVEKAKSRGIDARIGDGQKLDAGTGYDAVFSNAALHWMPEADAVAAGISRALKPGGRFIAEFGGAGNVQGMRAAVDAALRQLRHPRAGNWQSWYFPSIAEYATVLANAGLVADFARLFPRPITMDDAPERTGLERWLWVFATDLMQSLGPEATTMAQLAAEHAPHLRTSQSWQIDYVRIRVRAWKRA